MLANAGNVHLVAATGNTLGVACLLVSSLHLDSVACIWSSCNYGGVCEDPPTRNTSVTVSVLTSAGLTCTFFWQAGAASPPPTTNTTSPPPLPAHVHHLPSTFYKFNSKMSRRSRHPSSPLIYPACLSEQKNTRRPPSFKSLTPPVDARTPAPKWFKQVSPWKAHCFSYWSLDWKTVSPFSVSPRHIFTWNLKPLAKMLFSLMMTIPSLHVFRLTQC